MANESTPSGVPVSLFFKNQFYLVDDDRQHSAINFDCLLSESHKISSNVTSHPVMSGMDISDHIRNNLIEVKIKGLVSNFSLIPNRPTANTEVILSSDNTATIKNPLTPADNYAESAYQMLLTLWMARTTCTIITALDTYNNMAITNIEIERDGDTGDALVFDIDLKEIRRVDLTATPIYLKIEPSPKKPTGRQAAKKAKMGQKSTTKIDPRLTKYKQFGGSVGPA